MGSIHRVKEATYRLFVDVMIFQRNNQKRTHNADLNALVKRLGELNFPVEEWSARAVGIDLDINMHEVLSSKLDMTIEYDPMHLDRAFWRKWHSLGGSSAVKDLEQAGCSYGRWHDIHYLVYQLKIMKPE